MRLLPDTHILLGGAVLSGRLPHAATELISDARNELYFSAASIWEIAVKQIKARHPMPMDAGRLRRQLLANGYQELVITGEHAAATIVLPRIHADPFDRMLIAQATVKGITLLTADRTVADYPGPIRLV